MPPTADAAKRFNQKVRATLAAVVGFREPIANMGSSASAAVERR